MLVTDPNSFVKQVKSKLEIASMNGKRSVVIPDVYFNCTTQECSLPEQFADKIVDYFKANHGVDACWHWSGYAVQFEFGL